MSSYIDFKIPADLPKLKVAKELQFHITLFLKENHGDPDIKEKANTLAARNLPSILRADFLTEYTIDDLTYDNIIKWLCDDYEAAGSIGYKYISFFNAKREFGESVDGYVSRLNDLRRAAGLSEDFLIAKIICNIQKEYRTMLKNLTDVDLNTIKSLLKDIDEEKSLVADLNRFFRSGLQSNAPPPTKTTSPDYLSTPMNREIFSRPRKSSTDSQTNNHSTNNNNPTSEPPKPPNSYRNLQTPSTHPRTNHHHSPINTTPPTLQQNPSHGSNPMPTPSTTSMKNLKSQTTPRTWKNC